MNIFIELLPLLLGSLIGAAPSFNPVSARQRFVWLCLGFLCALIANLASGEGLLFLPVDVVFVSFSAFAVYKVKQQLIRY